MKITLQKIVRKDTDKQGNKLMTKDGRPYTRIGVQAREYGNQWISGFSASWNQDWKEGMEVEVEVRKNGEWLNLEKPDPMADFAKTIMALSLRVSKLEETISKKVEPMQDDIPVINEEIQTLPTDEDLLPF